MQNTSLYCRLAAVVGASALLSIAPASMRAQSGKWVATISHLSTVDGVAELTVEPRNDKQSRARINIHNTKRDSRLSWDIVEGSCRDQGKPIAPQAAFGGIQTQMDGTGSVSANVPKLESGKRYYLRVFDPKDAVTDESAYGCANISEKP